MKNEIITPNTINFLVIVESVKGIFLAEVYQSKIPNTDSVHNALLKDNSERIYPELSLDVIGILSIDNKSLNYLDFQLLD